MLSYSSGRKCTIHNNSPVIRLKFLTYTAIHTTVIRKTLHIPFTDNIVNSPLIPEIRIKTPSVNIFMNIVRIHCVKFLFFTKFKQPKAIFTSLVRVMVITNKCPFIWFTISANSSIKIATYNKFEAGVF